MNVNGNMRISKNSQYIWHSARIILLTILLLIILSCIPAHADDSDYQASNYFGKNNGYSLSKSVTLTLQGQRNKLRVDLSVFKSQSGEYWYALADQKRNISIAQNDGSKGRSIQWKPGDDCPSPAGVDTLYCLENVYDYYHNVLGWQMKDGLAIVAYLNKGFIDNAMMHYREDANLIYCYIGSARKNSVMFSAVPQVMAHEFTHAVLMHEGVWPAELPPAPDYPFITDFLDLNGSKNAKYGTESQAVHEGYCDVMGTCIFSANDWVYARNTTTQRDLAHPALTHYNQYKKDKTEEHDAGQLIGYAAFLMSKNEAPDNNTSIGDPLNEHLLAQLFYRSMKYLPTIPTFIDVSIALICSSQELCNMTDPGTGKLYMTREQAKRVLWALDRIGLYRPITFNPDHFSISLCSFDESPFNDYTVELRKKQTGDAIWSKDAEGMTTEIQVPDSFSNGWLIIKSKEDPAKEMRYPIVNDTYFFLLDPTRYLLTDYLFYTPFEPSSNMKSSTNDSEAMDSESLLNDYLKNTLIRQFTVMPTDTIYNSETRTNAELSGMLSAHIEDFDVDGQKELLINAFHMEPKADMNGNDRLLWIMQMFEAQDGVVALQAERKLGLPDFAGPQGKYGTTANAFTYKSGDKIFIALDSYYGINEQTTTVNAYHYDGRDFIYAGGVGYQFHGQGDMLIRQADEESAFDNVANCADWISYMSDNYSAWQTIHEWNTEAHDWNLPSQEEQESYFSLYQENLSRLGLNVVNDPRIPRKEAEDQENAISWEEQYNNRFLQIPESVYNDSTAVKSMWRIGTYMLLGGSLELHREDPAGSLDAYRF